MSNFCFSIVMQYNHSNNKHNQYKSLEANSILSSVLNKVIVLKKVAVLKNDIKNSKERINNMPMIIAGRFVLANGSVCIIMKLY